jgi:hypothetical protein
MESLNGQPGGSLAKATASVQELSRELAAPKPQDAQALPREPSRTQKAASPVVAGARPVPVELVEPPPNALQSLRNLAGPLLAPIGTAVIVVIFTLVILIKREDLRSRVLRLLGRGRLPRATQAFDDAAARVTRYLRMQFLVNTVFGTMIARSLPHRIAERSVVGRAGRPAALHALPWTDCWWLTAHVDGARGFSRLEISAHVPGPFS